MDSINENTLMRSTPCPECGAQMLWTQGVWPDPDSAPDVQLVRAAYKCLNGHVLDPNETRQCPACGVHDTARASPEDDRSLFECRRCKNTFRFPR